MRYPAAGKLEIIRPVEQSHLVAGPLLARIFIPSTAICRW